MTAKLSPDSIGLIFTMHAAGHPTDHIADAAGCSCATVVRYLNAAGILIGNKGKPRQCTDDYIALALDMRAQGKKWDDIAKGFAECFRVLATDGILIFKWAEAQVLVSELLALTDEKPLFGHKSGKREKTHWITFMKR